jgi:hypothetical protein
VPLNGETNRKSGVYKSVCCGAEIVINAGSTFPDCANHPNITMMWRSLVNNKITGLNRKRPELDVVPEAHIENRHLFDLAVGRLKLEEWEQRHLHGCKVCQGVLYVFVHQQTRTASGEAEKETEVA